MSGVQLGPLVKEIAKKSDMWYWFSMNQILVIHLVHDTPILPKRRKRQNKRKQQKIIR
jgi:hypothetical protein